jgi:hypothetical protein
MSAVDVSTDLHVHAAVVLDTKGRLSCRTAGLCSMECDSIFDAMMCALGCQSWYQQTFTKESGDHSIFTLWVEDHQCLADCSTGQVFRSCHVRLCCLLLFPQYRLNLRRCGMSSRSQDFVCIHGMRGVTLTIRHAHVLTMHHARPLREWRSTSGRPAFSCGTPW